MIKIPLVIKVAVVFILLSAFTWLVVGVFIATGVHPGMPSNPFYRWGMAAASFLAFMVLVVLA